MEEARVRDLPRFLEAEASHRPEPSSQARTIAALQTFFRFCVESEYLDRDPAAALLLLDDPVLGLGITHSETVLSQVRDAAHAHASAALMTTEHPSEVLQADTVLTLNAGMLIEAPRYSAHRQVVDVPTSRLS